MSAHTPELDYEAPDGGPRLLLSAKGVSKDQAHDYTCDYPGCDNRATDYLFLGPQFCERHWGIVR